MTFGGRIWRAGGGFPEFMDRLSLAEVTALALQSRLYPH